MDLIPIGAIIPFAGPVNKIPTNYRLCDGSPLDRTNSTFTSLFNVIGSSWGGDGADMFNLPDLRGAFLRGVDGAAGRDPDAGARTQMKPGGHAGNDVGTLQGDGVRRHSHSAQVEPNSGGHNHTIQINRNNICGSNLSRDCDSGGDKFNADPNLGSISASTTTDGAHNHGVTVSETGGNETRPVNAAVHWIIRIS